MRLFDLIGSDIAIRHAGSPIAGEIAGLTADSRLVQPGYLFAALPGRRDDGRRFIADALKRGAVAVLGTPGLAKPPGVALLESDNPRQALAKLAARFYGDQPRHIAAVTGTSGKTSVVAFARQLWTQLGHPAASLGTLGIVAPGFTRYGSLTTPDPVSLHQYLADLARSGVDHLAMEASSHGLDQYRLDGVRVTVAAFTNLTRDHLDYHATMADYFAAKKRLFSEVMVRGGVAVLNADVPEFAELAALARTRGHRIIDFGRQASALRLVAQVPAPEGQHLTLRVEKRLAQVTLPLVGDFQAMNALAALGLVIGCDEKADAAVALIASLAAVPGRLERVALRRNGAAVYVDYAHKPGALETVLRTLKVHAAGRLVVVLGCGGDRDPGKRPMMGEIAQRIADRVIVTDDNPRSEDPAKIRRQILVGCPGAREIGSRREAIFHAVAGLAAGDLLVVAGKGHESGQIVGETVLPFDDAIVAREAVAAADGEAA